MATLTIDVSHYDWDRTKGMLDWATIRNSVPIMCARASYGEPQTYNPATRNFAAMVAGAKKADFLLTGGYHNLIRGDQACINRQVDYFRLQLDTAGADWAMLDVEPYDALRTNNLWPRMIDAQRFAWRWNKVEPGRTLTFYIAQWVWSSWLEKADLSTLNGPIVNANYPSTTAASPDKMYAAVGGDSGAGWQPYGNITPALWQFTSKSIVPGASSTTDANAYRGTPEQFFNLVMK